MRTLVLVIAAAGLMFACSSSSTVKEAKSLKKRICACKDIKCAAVVQKDQVKWLADKGKSASKRDKVELAPVLMAHKKCFDALMKGTKDDVKGVKKKKKKNKKP